MKILVVSDTHGIDRPFYDLYRNLKKMDMVIHCGDLQGSEEDYSRFLNCPFAAVKGNNDFFTMLPKDRVFDYGGKRFFVIRIQLVHARILPVGGRVQAQPFPVLQADPPADHRRFFRVRLRQKQVVPGHSLFHHFAPVAEGLPER